MTDRKAAPLSSTRAETAERSPACVLRPSRQVNVCLPGPAQPDDATAQPPPAPAGGRNPWGRVFQGHSGASALAEWGRCRGWATSHHPAGAQVWGRGRPATPRSPACWAPALHSHVRAAPLFSPSPMNPSCGRQVGARDMGTLGHAGLRGDWGQGLQQSGAGVHARGGSVRRGKHSTPLSLREGLARGPGARAGAVPGGPGRPPVGLQQEDLVDIRADRPEAVHLQPQGRERGPHVWGSHLPSLSHPLRCREKPPSFSWKPAGSPLVAPHRLGWSRGSAGALQGRPGREEVSRSGWEDIRGPQQGLGPRSLRAGAPGPSKRGACRGQGKGPSIHTHACMHTPNMPACTHTRPHTHTCAHRHAYAPICPHTLNMSTCTSTYIHTRTRHMHVRTDAHTCARMHTLAEHAHMHSPVHPHTYTCMHIHTHTHMPSHVPTCMYACTPTCIHTRTCLHAHTHAGHTRRTCPHTQCLSTCIRMRAPHMPNAVRKHACAHPYTHAEHVHTHTCAPTYAHTSMCTLTRTLPHICILTHATHNQAYKPRRPTGGPGSRPEPRGCPLVPRSPADPETDCDTSAPRRRRACGACSSRP